MQLISEFTGAATSTQGGTFWLLNTDTEITLHIFVDHSVVEVYAQGGRARFLLIFLRFLIPQE